MFDFIPDESHDCHVLYPGADGHIHLMPQRCFARLQVGYSDAAPPQMAVPQLRFAIFHVVRLTALIRLADEMFSMLLLNADGNVDVSRDYDALQADVERLEATDYALLSFPDTLESLTSWSSDPFTHRRLIAALVDPHHEPWCSRWSNQPWRAA